MIDKEDVSYLDTIYKRKDDCNNEMDKVAEKLADNKAEFAKVNTKLSILIGILSTIGAAFLAYVLRIAFGG